MDGHLIPIEVGVECGADQGMNLDGFPLDKNRLERLNAKSMKRWRPVQQDRVIFDDVFQNVPNDGILSLHHFLCGFHRGAVAALLEPVVDKGLEELERHFLRQSALMKLQLGSDDDDRSSGIVHALSEKVLAETPLFALQRIRER